MHTMWKGSISFGLVNIPIKLFAATEDKDIKMRYLHKKCHNPIKYEKTCPICEQHVEQEDIVKGYEYEPGKFVLIEKEDLDKIAGIKNKSIEIIDFVSLEEIDPIYFNRSYFIGPGENGTKPFTLLKEAMKESGRIGLAKITIRSKESLAAVRVYDKGLVMETIYYPDEVRNVEHVPGIDEEVKVNEKELEMAKQLIEQLTTEFEPEKYKDEYREALLEIIDSKISGKEVKISEERPRTNVVDLMEALQASIDQSKTGEKKAESKPKKTKPKKKKA
ncbi:Ku protein [Fictibacillus fluitans]|uniref:Non-homologous end joining protein Ku n=1 Tax=Fictibacillus fluitans TaxID=3058422 RepID=A0ABT8HSH3_9BACL|nr:Ku protein [Fictibacillus sp. NE201]MDN4523706.1 Ku protein [Fictibacillus sp. NE201]